jgi:hypothetical protein
MNKYLIFLCVALFVVCLCLEKSLESSKAECVRLQGNQESLLADVTLYKTKAGESAASVQRLQLTKDELERNYQAMCEEARQLGLKVKRLQSAARTSTNSHLQVTAPIRDSIVYRDRPVPIDTLKAFAWYDPPWASITGVIDSGKVSMDVHMTDTIVQLVHRVPKKFLFFRFGTKAIRQEVKSKNPYTTIAYSEYIEIVK